MDTPLTQDEIDVASTNAAIGTELLLAEAGMRVWAAGLATAEVEFWSSLSISLPEGRRMPRNMGGRS